jgi:agmatinase
LNPEWFIQKGKFAYAFKDYPSAEIVLVGAPYDFTASNRAGARFGPQAIRAESYTGMEEYSPYFDMELTSLPIADLGDMDLPVSDKEKSLDKIYRIVKKIVADGKKPFLLGGEHLVTFPAFKAVLETFPELVLIQLDAHLDAIDELYGSKWSHGTVIRRCHELMNEDMRILQMGIRSGSREEYQWAKEHTILIPFNVSDGLNELKKLNNKPVYLTVDLDVFDPAQLPGTGTTEAGGIFFPEFMKFLMTIKKMNLNIVGCDVVELAPELDPTHSSSTLASKIVREILCVL